MGVKEGGRCASVCGSGKSAGGAMWVGKRMCGEMCETRGKAVN